jgi:hypothetical protein
MHHSEFHPTNAGVKSLGGKSSQEHRVAARERAPKQLARPDPECGDEPQAQAITPHKRVWTTDGRHSLQCDGVSADVCEEICTSRPQPTHLLFHLPILSSTPTHLRASRTRTVGPESADIMVFFKAKEHRTLPTKDLLSWIFDDIRYDPDKPVCTHVLTTTLLQHNSLTNHLPTDPPRCRRPYPHHLRQPSSRLHTQAGGWPPECRAAIRRLRPHPLLQRHLLSHTRAGYHSGWRHIRRHQSRIYRKLPTGATNTNLSRTLTPHLALRALPPHQDSQDQVPHLRA